MNLPSTSSERVEPLILVVDLETTGTNANRNSIIQFGAVWLSGAEGEIEMDCRAFDGAELHPKALEVNGCSEARCLNPALMSEAEALAQFFAWIKLHTDTDDQPFILAGLNPSFDRSFLMQAWLRAGRPIKLFPVPHRTIDLHTLAITYAMACDSVIPSRGLYTDEIYAVLDLPPEPKPHTALTGARREADALHKLMALAPRKPAALRAE